VIQIRQHLVPHSRTQTGSLWEAFTEIGGKTYTATSRHGAPQALARKLLIAGIPGHQPVEVFSQVCTYDNGTEIHTEELRGCVTYRTLYAMARTTLEEGDRPLRRARFKERPQIAFPLQPGAAETRFTPPDDVVVIPEPDPLETGRRRCVSCGGDFVPVRRDQRFCSSTCRLQTWRAQQAKATAI
jgi:hypothetical protein